MTHRRLGVSLLISAACGPAGCASAGQPVRYSGETATRRCDAQGIAWLRTADRRFARLGEVSASCALRPGFRAVHGERLSDLDCSSWRLGWMLREAAADAGGEVLVGGRCVSTQHGTETRIECSAGVARAGESVSCRPRSARPAPSPGQAARLEEPDARLAARIRVSFAPTAGAEPRFSERPEMRELEYLPLGHQPLGALSLRCRAGCDERALRHGALIAAGRLGATEVVGMACASSAGATRCLATLAATAADTAAR